MEVASEKRTPQQQMMSIRDAAMDKSRAIGGGLVNVARMAAITRNGPCPCGSGRKFKRCCRAK